MEELLSVFLGIISILLIVATVIWFVFAWGLYMLAKDRNAPNPWMAWLPLLSYYLMGSLVNDEMSSPFKYILPMYALLLPLFSTLLSAAVYLLAPVTIIFCVLITYITYKLFTIKLDTFTAILLAIFFPPIGWIIIGIKSH